MPNYKVQAWVASKKAFVDVMSDVIENTHYDSDLKNSTDFSIYFEGTFEPDEIKVFKLIKTQTRAQLLQMDKAKSQHSLSIQGISEEGEVIFMFSDKTKKLSQTFGFNLKKYNAHENTYLNANRMFQNPNNIWADELMNVGQAEGVYSLVPQWNDQAPHQFSTLNNDITFQGGQLVEQWSIFFRNDTSGEKAVVSVRYSPIFEDIIEFNVETAPIPLKDNKGKDIIATWKVFDEFDPKGVFYTDSNGLEMQERLIQNQSHPFNTVNAVINNGKGPNFLTIAANYYPVSSAIAMRDKSELSNIQVTVMNDRPQGGSADLQKATIELMHFRRLNQEDRNNKVEILNETDANGVGLRATTRYFMQIFDWTKGGSKQRDVQINLQQPLQYTFAFDFSQDAGATKQVSSVKANNEKAISFLLQQGHIRLVPLGKNQIIMRLENLADSFDGDSGRPNYVNIQKYARELYLEINNKAPASIDIVETSLSSNAPLEQVNLEKWQWQAIEDPNSAYQFVQPPIDRGGLRGVALEPQRIRAFTITFNKDPKAANFGFRKHRASNDNTNPVQVLRKKN